MSDKNDKKGVTDPNVVALFSDKPQSAAVAEDNSGVSPTATSGMLDPDVVSLFKDQPDSGLKKNTDAPAQPVDVVAPTAPVTTSLATKFLHGEVAGSQQGGISVKQDDGTIVTDHPTKGRIVETPQQFEKRTTQDHIATATDYLAKDVIQSNQNKPQVEQGNTFSTNFHAPGNPIHDVTNPFGDPSTTSAYVKDRVVQLEKMKQDELAQSGANNPFKDAGSPNAYGDVTQKYDQQIADVKKSASTVLALQLFNKDYTQKKLTPEEYRTSLATSEKQRQKEIQEATDDLNEKVPGNDKYDVNPAATQAYNQKIREINNRFDSEQRQLQNNTKYNPVLLGAEHAAALGDQNAQLDLQRLQVGKPISPANQYRYNVSGRNIIQTGTKATSNESVEAEGQAHSDISGKELFQNNKPYIVGEAQQAIGNRKYEDENPILHAIIPSQFLSDMSVDDIEKYGKEMGYTPEIIAALKEHPEDIPKSASLPQQFAKGFVSPGVGIAGGIYQNAVKGAGALLGGDMDAINEHFQPGWEESRGLSAAISGNTPSEQNTFGNIRGAVGQIVNTVGNISSLGTEVTGASDALKGIGLATKTADRAANFGVMSLLGYNDAYDRVGQIIGTDPKDEFARQTYSVVAGLTQGGLFSIHPPGHLLTDALGQETKSGEQFLKELQNTSPEKIFTPQFKASIKDYVAGTAKELGWQVSQMDASKIANNIYDNIADKKKNHDLGDGLTDETVNTTISMFLPSLLGAIGRVKSETPLNYAVSFEVGSNPEKYRASLQDQLAKGDINQDQFQKLNDFVNTAGQVVANTPTENADGVKLTPDQIKKYAYGMLAENVFQKKADAINEKAAASGITPDKAQLAPINKSIADLQKVRDEILKNAGAPPVVKKEAPASKQEELNPEEGDERSVAMMSDQGEKPTEKKDTETLGNVKEDVSLNSSDNSQEKSTENESSENNGRRETTDKREGQNTDGKSPEDSESRNEAGQDRPIVSAKNETAPADEKPAGEPVRKKRKLTPEPQQEVPTTKTPDLAAWDLADKEGLPKADHEQEIRDTPNDEKIGGGESFDEFRDRIKKAWENTTSSAKDDALLVAHSGVMKMVEAAEKHGWDNTDALRKAYNEAPEPPVGQINQYETENGTIHVTRHGQAEDNLDGNLREKDTPLTDKGREQAVTIVADQLKEDGIRPSEIISSDLPRATETADIVKDEFSHAGQDFLPPQPSKPLHEMTGSELSDYHKELKDFNKNIDKKVLGEDYDRYEKAQRTTNSITASTERREEADKVIAEIESKLTPAQENALFGMNLPKGTISNPEDVRDYRDKVEYVEMAENEGELSRYIAQSLIELNNAPKEFDEMSHTQKLAFTALRSAKRVIEERGYDGKIVTQEALKNAANKFGDQNDAEFMLSKYLNFKSEKKPQDSALKEIQSPNTATKEKRKGKLWNPAEYQSRRKAVLDAEPKSLQEHILQTMMGMTDNHPERKWKFGDAELKDLPESERKSQKYYLNDDAPNHKSIDVWAQDLLNSVGEHDNPPFDLSGHDSHSIRNEVIDAINSHPSKHHVLETLENLHEKQREDAPDMNEREYIESQRLSAISEEHISSILSEEAQKVFGKVQDAISEDISPEDSEVLHEYLSSHIGEDGILKGHEIDPFEKDYQEAHDKLSKDGQRLLDTITEVDQEKQKGLLEQIKEKTQHAKDKRNSEKQTSGPDTSTSEGKPDKSNAKGAGPAEGGPGKREERSAGKKVESFETSKGSVYKYDEEGNTTRFKTATGEQNEKQDLAVFVKFNSPDQQQDFLRGIQDRERTGTKVYVIDKDGKVYDKNADIKGKDVKLALYDTKANKIIDTVETKQEPTIGYNTYDQRRFKQDGEDVRQSHIGNEVSKINYADTEEKPAPTEERKSQIATDKLSPNELIRKKQERLNQLHDDRLDITNQKEELEAKINTAQASTHPNQDVIDELNGQLSEVNNQLKTKEAAIKLKEREIEIQKGYSQTADAIRNFADKNAKNSKGMLGTFPLLNPENASLLLKKVADLYEKFGNINIAAVRALEWAREHLSNEKEIGNINEGHIRDLLTPIIRPLSDEPIIKMPEHLQVAKDWLDDIEKKRVTYDDARQEILDSEGVSDKTKGNVQNWIDWHLKGGEPAERSKPEGLSFENDDTSIKNDTTRLHRQQLGLDDEIQAAKKEFGESWSDAQKKISEEPAYPQELITSLSKNPRPINDVENATLLHEQNRLRLRLKDIYADINKAAEDGNEAGVTEGKVAKAGVLDKLQQIFDVNKAVGTENGRGLAARRMMVNDRYELTNMIAEKRATANDGQPLTDQQQAEIENLHQKIQETQDAFDAYQRQKEAEVVKLQRQVLSSRQDKANSGNKSPKSQTKGESSVLKSKAVADKLRAWADKQDKVIKNSAFSSPIPITPQMITKAVRLIADGIEKGGEVLDLVQQSIKKLRDDNPGVDETHLEKEINGALIDAGVSAANPVRKKALQAMTGLFKDGKLDHEAVRLNVAANRAKDEFEIEIKRDLEKQLSTKEKAQNWFVKWQRANKLSGPLTLGKLTTAGATRLLLTDPAESIVGSVYSKLIPRLANGAIGEGGGFNVKETAKAYTSGIMRGLKDAGQVMTKGNHGKSELDILFGKGGDLPPAAIEFFGTLHSAIKAPVKRAVFERQLEKRVRRNMDAGVDVSDPLVMTSIMDDSYKDANRAIFMQENKAAKWWNDGVRRMEQVDPVTGKTPTGNKVAATAMQWMMPFVKVSSNLVAETARGIYGLPVGAGQVLHAYITKNIENLSSDQKDIILRNLKKGSLGVAAMSIGFFNPQNFGGYYQPGQKKKENDADWMGMKFGDTKLPPWLAEAPIFHLMQLAATARRVADHYIHGEKEGIPAGVMAALMGVTQDNAMVSEPVKLAKLFGSKYDREQFTGELVKSTVVPALVSYLAKATDPADEGSPVRKALDPHNKRKSPKTMIDHIKSGIPFLREDLDEK